MSGTAEGVDDVALEAFSSAYADVPSARVAVVIAAYNEERSIADVVRAVPSRICDLAAETIVVVDGSVDATAREARAAGALVCDVAVNRGQGAALRLGYRLARERGAAYVATIDADGQYDAAELAAVVLPLVDGRADLVTGSRRLGRSHTADRTRRAGVVVFGALITALTGTRITDPANGLRAMRAEVTEAVALAQPQYQASELLVGAIMRGYRVVEVPTVMRERTAGSTKKGGNLGYGARFARVVVATWWRDRHLRPGGASGAGPASRVLDSTPGISGVDGVAVAPRGSTKITNS